MDTGIIKARDAIDAAVEHLNNTLRRAARLGMNVSVNTYLSETGKKGTRSTVECWEAEYEAWAPIPAPKEA